MDKIFGMPLKIATEAEIAAAMRYGKMTIGVDKAREAGGVDMCCEAYRDRERNAITIVDVYPLAT